MMDTIDPEAREQILKRTLEAVHAKRRQREARAKLLASTSVLCLVGLAGTGLGLFVGHGPRLGHHTAMQLPEIPLGVAGGTRAVPPVEEAAAIWDAPSSLVLVVNEDGMEMRALNDAQVRALARKPGCEFALTPDAVMWVSECGIEGDAFSPPLEF